MHLTSTQAKEALKKIASRVPIRYRQPPLYWRWRNFLKQSDRWSIEQIQQWQFTRLQELLNHAYENTEGYRYLYKKAGVTPYDIRTWKDYKLLPFVTKRDIQSNIEAFSVPDKRRKYITTSGSTGIPFGFYNSPSLLTLEDAFIHSGWTRTGWDLGDLSAVLRGGYIGSPSQVWKLDRFNNELCLSTFHLTSETLPRYLEALKHHRPRVLQAYPSALNIFCDLLKDAGQLGQISFDVIFLGSENLYDWQTRKFETAFPHAKLFSWYGHSEKTILAPWCEDSRLHHLWPFYGYTEVIDEAGKDALPGTEGELIGTSFHNYLTPFIRYRTMDRAIKGPTACPACNRPFETLSKIIGRDHEVIVTSKGQYIPMIVINAIHDQTFDHLLQFQFFQEDPGKVTFKYIPKGDITANMIATIESQIKLKFGNDVEILMKSVPEIDPTKSGKFQILEQKLAIR